MRAGRQNIEFLIAHLKDLEQILQVCAPKVFSEEFNREDPLVLTGSLPEELSGRLEAIVSDCDTVALNPKAISTATAIADAASLLLQSIERGESRIVAVDPTLTEEENFLAKFYTSPPKLNEAQLLLDTQLFIDARDYARKALELLKPLARSYSYDIASLELQGEMYV